MSQVSALEKDTLDFARNMMDLSDEERYAQYTALIKRMDAALKDHKDSLERLQDFRDQFSKLKPALVLSRASQRQDVRYK